MLAARCVRAHNITMHVVRALRKFHRQTPPRGSGSCPDSRYNLRVGRTRAGPVSGVAVVLVPVVSKHGTTRPACGGQLSVERWPVIYPTHPYSVHTHRKCTKRSGVHRECGCWWVRQFIKIINTLRVRLSPTSLLVHVGVGVVVADDIVSPPSHRQRAFACVRRAHWRCIKTCRCRCSASNVSLAELHACLY